MEHLPDLKVVLWGPPGCGKTTFLAALDIAVARTSPPWRLTGATYVATALLIEMTQTLVGRHRFPEATIGTDYAKFVMTGEFDTAVPERSPDRVQRTPVQLNLSVTDPSGELFMPERADYQDARRLVDVLAESNGIVFFFDPLREAQNGDTYEAFHATVKQLERRMSADNLRLPHHVAVCIAKFDHPSVFSVARDTGCLAMDPDDPYGFPRVADDNAANFFDTLRQRLSGTGAPLLHHTIERHFIKDHIRYFAVSSIGYHLNESLRFDQEDYYNIILRDDFSGWGRTELRGAVHPINVLEPILWLASPDRHNTAPHRQRKFVPMTVSAGQVRHERRRAAPVTATTGSRANAQLNHLICLVEIGGGTNAVAERLRCARELISASTVANPGLRVSVISYGSHSVSSRLCESPATVLGWQRESGTLLRLLDNLEQRYIEQPEYALAAQLECALAEIARRLSATDERAAVVTLGSRPAFPARMDLASQTLPCPERNDWRIAFDQLRELGIIFGAIRTRNMLRYPALGANDDIWPYLGADAVADIDEANLFLLLKNLGLLSQDKLAYDALLQPTDPPPSDRHEASPAEETLELPNLFTEESLAPPEWPTEEQPGQGIPLNWDDE